MKKSLKVLMAMVLVLISCVICDTVNSQFPLPQDVKIAPLDPNLPLEIRAFLGKWKGIWNNKTLFSIEVTKIDLEKAEITYTAPETSMLPAANFSETAEVILGEKPKIQFHRVWRSKSGNVGAMGWFAFEMQKDLKTLKGVGQWAQGTSKATLEKTD
jgi:hypothetical protein